MTVDGILHGGPGLSNCAETYSSHVRRFGLLPIPDDSFIDVLDKSGLRGRGGAAFPVAAKWQTVLREGGGRTAILANGAEGEPLSHKDRVLMEKRPHLVIDGALLAAKVLRADRIVFYIGVDHKDAAASMTSAMKERPDVPRNTSIVLAPGRFVAGEESAAVHCVNDNVALPTTKPPRPFQRGIQGRPTLVQNVESLAYVALLARRGTSWSDGLGVNGHSGSSLITVTGATNQSGVCEVPTGVTVTEALELSGGVVDTPSALLLGGYFGGWVPWETARTLPLDTIKLRAQGLSLGCGVIHVIGQGTCGVAETASILAYLAGESSRQCGPCVFGLRAVSNAVTALAANQGHSGDLARLSKWGREIRGRGACAHPDGSAGFLESALMTFGDEFIRHQENLGCGLLAS